jgi:serine/threonine-protein phosphatase 2A regulatory subunit A
MEEDDDQSLHPVQILIDELKNDDLELRMNSMRSLSKIAEALGPDRTRKELIPFLCLSAIDDEDDVLVVLAEQLGSFPALVGHEFSHILVPPLEQLASVEDEHVRNQVFTFSFTYSIPNSNSIE